MSAVASATTLSGEQVTAFELGEGPAAALCLHGFTGTPYEVRPLGEEVLLLSLDPASNVFVLGARSFWGKSPDGRR